MIRYYAANPESLSIATWTIHKRQCNMISEKERNAIRFIRMIKFSLAKQAFESLRTQTDVRDVLEQYRIGHSSILYRIKEIQSDLSQIVGKVQTNGRRMHESRLGLSERMQSFERIQNNFDSKLDISIELLLAEIRRLSKTDDKLCVRCSQSQSFETSPIVNSRFNVKRNSLN